jgi:Winged helix DNA-binding domain
VAARERRKLLARLGAHRVARDPERWLRDVEAETVRALGERGEATANELVRDVPGLGTKILLAEGRSYEAEQSVAVWVLLGLAAQGRIVRGRPRGTWISRQYRWAPFESWLREPLAAIATDEARAELVRRWLTAFGPGTVADLKWWTGLTLGEVRRALTAVRAVDVELEGGGPGVVLPGDVAPTRRRAPRAVLLPSLDSTVMGWAERDWYLGPHRAALFDRNGNAGPTVWWDGRVVGGWGQRQDGGIAFRLLEDVGREAADAAEAEASRLETWLAGARVTPTFPTPLEREVARG